MLVFYFTVKMAFMLASFVLMLTIFLLRKVFKMTNSGKSFGAKIMRFLYRLEYSLMSSTTVGEVTDTCMVCYNPFNKDDAVTQLPCRS